MTDLQKHKPLCWTAPGLPDDQQRRLSSLDDESPNPHADATADLAATVKAIDP